MTANIDQIVFSKEFKTIFITTLNIYFKSDDGPQSEVTIDLEFAVCSLLSSDLVFIYMYIRNVFYVTAIMMNSVTNSAAESVMSSTEEINFFLLVVWTFV